MECMVSSRDPNGAGRLLTKLAQGHELGLDLLKSRSCSARARARATHFMMNSTQTQE
jgi:hypothetical protein